MTYFGAAQDDRAAILLAMRKDNAGTRDWPDDFGQENGNYWCKCSTCGKQFTGHKRRLTCRVCAA